MHAAAMAASRIDHGDGDAQLPPCMVIVIVIVVIVVVMVCEHQLSNRVVTYVREIDFRCRGGRLRGPPAAGGESADGGAVA